MSGPATVAVRVHISDADFYLLPKADDDESAQRLVHELTQLRETGGTLRLRPRTAPPVDEEPRLTGHEDPGTSWRDVLSDAVGPPEQVAFEPTFALWHWAIRYSAIDTHDSTDFEVG